MGTATQRRLSLNRVRPTSLLTAVLLCAWASPALGAPAVSCHCFRDRSFDAAAPAAVDPYLLATTQNSLFAATFGVPKKAVVKAKMTGTDGDRLWVARYLARSSGRNPDDLLEARGEAASWAEALSRSGVEVRAPLPAGGDDAALASAVVDQVLATGLGAPATVLGELRTAGASNAEVIAAVYLGLRTGRPPPALYAEMRSGATTWGTLLDGTGLGAEDIEGDLAGRLR